MKAKQMFSGASIENRPSVSGEGLGMASGPLVSYPCPKLQASRVYDWDCLLGSQCCSIAGISHLHSELRDF